MKHLLESKVLSTLCVAALALWLLVPWAGALDRESEAAAAAPLADAHWLENSATSASIWPAPKPDESAPIAEQPATF